MRNLALTLLVSACLQAEPCQNHDQLDKPGFQYLGVRFDTDNRELKRQFKKALDFWSRVIMMEWGIDNSSGCSISVSDDAESIPEEDIAYAYADGTIRFDLSASPSRQKLYSLSVHELGHLLGLKHDRNYLSVMYAWATDTPEFLTSADMQALSQKHSLRPILVR